MAEDATRQKRIENYERVLKRGSKVRQPVITVYECERCKLLDRDKRVCPFCGWTRGRTFP